MGAPGCFFPVSIVLMSSVCIEKFCTNPFEFFWTFDFAHFLLSLLFSVLDLLADETDGEKLEDETGP